jgi:hypothetical protein
VAFCGGPAIARVAGARVGWRAHPP